MMRMKGLNKMEDHVVNGLFFLLDFISDCASRLSIAGYIFVCVYFWSV